MSGVLIAFFCDLDFGCGSNTASMKDIMENEEARGSVLEEC